MNLVSRKTGKAVQVGTAPAAVASRRTAGPYVANEGSGTVTPSHSRRTRHGPALSPGYAPDSVAVTPDGRHVVVSDGDSDQASVLDAVSGSARHAGVGDSPDPVAVSGSGAFVVKNISGTVTPLTTVRAARIAAHFPVAAATTG